MAPPDVRTHAARVRRERSRPARRSSPRRPTSSPPWATTPPRCRRSSSAAASPRARCTSTDLLARAREAGSLRAGIDPAELARTVVALGTGVRVVCLADGGYAAVRERTEAAWSVLLAGVAEPAWLERWHAAGGMATAPEEPGGVSAGGPDAAARGVP